MSSGKKCTDRKSQGAKLTLWHPYIIYMLIVVFLFLCVFLCAHFCDARTLPFSRLPTHHQRILNIHSIYGGSLVNKSKQKNKQKNNNNINNINRKNMKDRKEKSTIKRSIPMKISPKSAQNWRFMLRSFFNTIFDPSYAMHGAAKSPSFNSGGMER